MPKHFDTKKDNMAQEFEQVDADQQLNFYQFMSI